MIKIYHNPKCSKSRQTLAIVKEKTSIFEIVEYIKNPLSAKEITVLLSQLNITAIDLIRREEAIWKENYKGKELTEKEIITAMVKYPKIIQRPIITNGNRAVLGRPPENVLKIID